MRQVRKVKGVSGGEDQVRNLERDVRGGTVRLSEKILGEGKGIQRGHQGGDQRVLMTGFWGSTYGKVKTKSRKSRLDGL